MPTTPPFGTTPAQREVTVALAASTTGVVQQEVVPLKPLAPRLSKFAGQVHSYVKCCTLLSPSLEMPPQDWWDQHVPELRRKMGGGSFGSPAAQQKDFDLAFSDLWTLQMDAALMSYASERAEIKQQKDIASLSPADLIALRPTTSDTNQLRTQPPASPSRVRAT
eukprot:COSAG05_NODE_3948_length_1756_cov_7.670489_3_plen_164_part_01